MTATEDKFPWTTYGDFQKWGYPHMDGSYRNIPLKCMIWGYPYFGGFMAAGGCLMNVFPDFSVSVAWARCSPWHNNLSMLRS